MNKHWKRNQQNGFILSVDGQEIGEMNVNFSGLNKSATFNIRQDQLTRSIPSFFILDLKVVEGKFSISAAPPGPQILPSHFFRIVTI